MRESQRHIGYVIVPVVNFENKKEMLPSLWKAWGYPVSMSSDHTYTVVWTSRKAALKARRKIFAKTYKTMRVCRIRMECY